MPATSELLVEEIRATQQALASAATPEIATQLSSRLLELNKKLVASQQALNESSSVLKG